MALTLEQWNLAFSSQGQAFLLGAQESAHLMPDGSRIVAITYAPGARTGSWQPLCRTRHCEGSDGLPRALLRSGPGSTRHHRE
jgi:hypothetical protein